MTFDYDKLRKALEGATPGPWRAGRSTFYPGLDGPLTARVYTDYPPEEFEAVGDRCFHNATLIALAPDMARMVLAAQELADRAFEYQQWREWQASHVYFPKPPPHPDGSLDAAEEMFIEALAAFRAAENGEE